MSYLVPVGGGCWWVSGGSQRLFSPSWTTVMVVLLFGLWIYLGCDNIAFFFNLVQYSFRAANTVSGACYALFFIHADQIKINVWNQSLPTINRNSGKYGMWAVGRVTRSLQRYIQMYSLAMFTSIYVCMYCTSRCTSQFVLWKLWSNISTAHSKSTNSPNSLPSKPKVHQCTKNS